jgi:hypothetical protein
VMGHVRQWLLRYGDVFVSVVTKDGKSLPVGTSSSYVRSFHTSCIETLRKRREDVLFSQISVR